MDQTVVIMLIPLIICAIVCTTCWIVSSRRLNSYKEAYERLFEKVICNDDIVEEAFTTLSEAYGISEGDLRDYISRRQNEHQANGK